jgi:hypothetical protein
MLSLFGAKRERIQIREINPLRPELNPSAQRCLTKLLLGILLLEPCIFQYMCEKPTNTPIIHSV